MSNKFDWNHPGLNSGHFHSLANLLSLRNGGQAEPPSWFEPIHDDDDRHSDNNSDEDAHSIDTRTPHQISDSGHGKLKRRFLDCLAEFAANKKGSAMVACSAMQEGESNVTVWVARNEGFSKEDESTFDKLGKLLESLSGVEVDRSETLLWMEMVSYHQNRIEQSYIPRLRVSFKAYDASRKTDEMNDTLSSSTDTLDKYPSLVTIAYKMRRTKVLEEALNTSSHAASKSKAFLKETLGILRIDYSPTALKAVLGQGCNVAKVEREFAKRQKQRLQIHAEVQMLLFLSTNETPISDHFPYLGCSKLSCFMCHRFIQAYGRFETRGCHGRHFRCWTVPGLEGPRPGQADLIAKALRSVQKQVKKTLKASIEGPLNHQRTSVAGGSSLLSNRKSDPSLRQLQIDRLRMKAEQDRVAEIFRRWVAVSSQLREDAEDLEWECDICWKPTKRKCSICDRGHFCSESCQEKRFGGHLFTCSKRPLTSADYLWRSLAEDLMPREEDVLKDFGFNNAIFDGDKPMLMGVYGGLYRSGEVSAETIHEWRIRGILEDKIKEFYHAIPENSRRGPYLDIEDQDKAPRDLLPESKRDCYCVLAQIIHRNTPNPIEIAWYSFGFVTCRGHADESVTFTQFWKAHEAGELIQLMDSKGLNEMRSRLPFLEEFLSVPPAGPRPSVWDLKQFLEINDPIEYPPIAAVAVDYWVHINCQTFEETCTLMEIYRKILEFATPLELHQVCLFGRLYELASLHPRLQMEVEWAALMRNPYPLEEAMEPDSTGELRSEEPCE
ncbi:hypothetical protein BU23DRAFT_577533 [Bimuria novae-zelandiae CBS 107.79]|uniref:MYND-type domain-containing protein n=1 Tax=Bimuria novae-zelandiae CBS 107.79 TaxID=1447943 RepID=A0A6A5VMD2_9PLEO|nr:hypothetical protein BU23DRAFT_577533 [Bimuria novae-zelandiae CBS 107.79]